MLTLARRSARSLLMGGALAAALSACDGSASTTGDASGGGATVANATYYRDVKPILDAKCVNCHAPGAIGPFALDTYAAAKEHAAAIDSAVQSGRMPPWPAGPDCNEYLDDRSLSDEQKLTIAAWSGAGAEEGDPSAPGAPLQPTNSRVLSRVDRELGLAEPYTMQLQPDDYRCFVLDWSDTTTKYITGFGAIPGNPAVVHHVIAFLATPSQVADAVAKDEAEPGPGYTCYGGPGFDSDWLGAWAPGSLGSDFPEGTGLRIEPGSKIVLQVHYNALTSGPDADQTRIALRIDDDVTKEAKLQPWTNPKWLQGDAMLIPAASKGTTHTWAQDPTLFFADGKSITIYNPSLHMHQLGVSARLSVERAGGGEACLLDIPRWDFHWQGSYGLVEPVVFNPGDQLRLSCTWDNTTMSDVTWGEGTTDEMCLGSFYYTVND